MIEVYKTNYLFIINFTLKIMALYTSSYNKTNLNQ